MCRMKKIKAMNVMEPYATNTSLKRVKKNLTIYSVTKFRYVSAE